jgi:carbon monoxide dehydrogenase subunit G
MKIESKKGVINCPSKEVYTYLMDMNNFKNLLPADKISNWVSDEKSCSFKIQGATTISFIIESSEEPNLIHLISGDESPFAFNLDIHLEEENGTTTGYQVFSADINMFMKMMVEKPLKNLFDFIVDRLEDELN